MERVIVHKFFTRIHCSWLIAWMNPRCIFLNWWNRDRFSSSESWSFGSVMATSKFHFKVWNQPVANLIVTLLCYEPHGFLFDLFMWERKSPGLLQSRPFALADEWDVTATKQKNARRGSEGQSWTPSLQLNTFRVRFTLSAGLEGCQLTPDSVYYVLDLLNLDLNGPCNDWVQEYHI